MRRLHLGADCREPEERHSAPAALWVTAWYYNGDSQEGDLENILMATCPRAWKPCGLAFREAISGQKLTNLGKRRFNTRKSPETQDALAPWK